MPVENFKEIVRCSQLGVPLENDLMEWLGECLSEVNGRGGVPWWLASAMQERNKALRALARYHFADLPRSQQARGIEALSSRYMASAWRFDRNRPEMPLRYKRRPQEWLWRAFKSGAFMPLSQRQLRNIL
jgi:hypothetical protein